MPRRNSRIDKAATEIIKEDVEIIYGKFAEFMNQQTALIKEHLPELGNNKMSKFKVRVQDLGRIVIPEAEREIHDIKKGDLVQVIIWKVRKPE